MNTQAHTGHTRDRRVEIAVVGVGPRGTSVAERFVAASIRPDFHGPIRVHLIDPYVGQGGAVWRRDQSRVLLMNTQTWQSTAYPDASTRPLLGAGIGQALTFDAFASSRGYGPEQYAPRAEHGEYLAHVLEHARAVAHPSRLEFVMHRASVIDSVVESPGDDTRPARHILHLRDEDAQHSELRVDAAIFALGHLATEPGPRLRALRDFAAQHALPAAMPNNPLDVEYAQFLGCTRIAVEGMGLNFFDALGMFVDLWQGAFEDSGRGDGSLTYMPSGREARLLVGSRSSMVYRAKPDVDLHATPAYIPVVLTDAWLDEVSAKPGSLDYNADIVPLIVEEVARALEAEGLWGVLGERNEHSHADVVRRVEAYLYPWNTEDPSGTDHGEPDWHARIARLVRECADRSAQPVDPAWLTIFRALTAIRKQINELVARNVLTAQSLHGQWFFGGQNAFASWASGPPLVRMRQLDALVRAGFVEFTGPGMSITVGDGPGFHVSAVSGKRWQADGFLAAHLPAVSFPDFDSELVRNLRARGEIRAARTEVGPSQEAIATGSIDLADTLFAVAEDSSVCRGRIFLGPPVSTAQPGSAITAEPQSGAQLLINAERAVVESLGYTGVLDPASLRAASMYAPVT